MIPTRLSNLLRAYRDNVTSSDWVVVEFLAMVDDNNAQSILAAIPPTVLPALREYVSNYVPDKMLSFGGAPIPSPEQVDLARHWLANRDHGMA